MNSDAGRFPGLDAVAAQRLRRTYTGTLRIPDASRTADGH
jgi:hypothetical protein